MTFEKEVITSRKNALVSEAAALLDKKGREAARAFRFDGVKLFLEAVSAGVALKYIFIKESERDKISVTVENAYAKAKCKFCGRAVVLADHVFDKITEEKGAQGIVCVAPYLDGLHIRISADGRIGEEVKKAMALSSVRDPGNIGTMLRSAGAFGIDTLIMSADCADIYNSKTVRAAMGALFRERIYIAENLAMALGGLRESGRRVFAADPDATARPIGEIGLRESDCIVIGNEGHGIAPDVREVCTGSVFIPISSTTESLNASIAGAICMWEMSKL